MDPTPDCLLELDTGQEIRVHLDGGRSVDAEVADPRHPGLKDRRTGNGRVFVLLKTANGRRSLAAYHEDKNPDRREDLTKFEVPSLTMSGWKAVAGIEAIDP